MKFVSLFRLNSPQMLVHTMESALKFFITVSQLSSLHFPSFAAYDDHSVRLVDGFHQLSVVFSTVVLKLALISLTRSGRGWQK